MASFSFPVRCGCFIGPHARSPQSFLINLMFGNLNSKKIEN